MSVDVSKIKTGDRVRVSLYGLPESDWLDVVGIGLGRVKVTMPDGRSYTFLDGDLARCITAHEPAAPALPDWWGSPVIHREAGAPCGPYSDYEVYNAESDVYVDGDGNRFGPDDYSEVDEAVTVVVDRDGNQPDVDRLATVADEWEGMYKAAHAAQVKAEAERDKLLRFVADRLSAVHGGTDQ